MFFQRKSGRGILSGLSYYLSQKYEENKTQRLIARSLKTTEMTVRASYRNWTKQFPDLLNLPMNQSRHVDFATKTNP
jgi:transcription initiation factor TFIIIB Brf1 subunit/transcription initiation factor TFIIB